MYNAHRGLKNQTSFELLDCGLFTGNGPIGKGKAGEILIKIVANVFSLIYRNIVNGHSSNSIEIIWHNVIINVATELYVSQF